MKKNIGKILEFLCTYKYKGNKEIIVSTYNSYEWIFTYKTRSIRIYILSQKLQRPTCNMEFEKYDPSKDQITYCTPYGG